MTVATGDVIAEKYCVERLLGRGGMGYVVAARHLTLDQRVAVKFLRAEAMTSGDALTRFRQEAKASVRLKSEHVATVIDVGVHGNEPYIVMEYLEGADLGARMRDARGLPIFQACDFIIQACEGLAEAHALGLVHRDIKLPNLFLTKTRAGDPLVKILDFGVAKDLTAVAGGDVTQTAACIGSPKYMSPEQMNDARGVDARTDIWALGVCLYRLITGCAPFDADSIGRLCTMVLHERPPSMASLCPGVPMLLELVVAACLQKDRDHRFGNVAELAAALAPFASEPGRAVKTSEHIAAVLGVAPSPPGCLPPSPTADDEANAFDRPVAWAHTTPTRPPYRRPSDIRFLSAGLFLLGLMVALMFVFPRGPLTRKAYGSAAGAPPNPVEVPVLAAPETVTQQQPVGHLPPPPPTATVDPPAASGSPTPASTAPHRRVRRGPSPKAQVPRAREEEAFADAVLIPADRK
jgi:serine/threonine-protein kinase